MKLNYNIHEAISYRSKTLAELNFICNPVEKDRVLTFKDTILLTEIGAWPSDPPLGRFVLGGTAYEVKPRTTTKQQWKKLYRDHRIYIKGDYEPEY